MAHGSMRCIDGLWVLSYTSQRLWHPCSTLPWRGQRRPAEVPADLVEVPSQLLGCALAIPCADCDALSRRPAAMRLDIVGEANQVIHEIRESMQKL